MLFSAILLILYPVVISSAHCIGNDLPVPEFAESRKLVSDAGHVRLSWEVSEESGNLSELEFELQQTTDRTFQDSKTIYSGPDRASFISGLADGNYRFRVRAILNNEAGMWSAPVAVQVEHQSLRLAFTLLGLGAIVVFATIVVVVVGNRKAHVE